MTLQHLCRIVGNNGQVVERRTFSDVEEMVTYAVGTLKIHPTSSFAALYPKSPLTHFAFILPRDEAKGCTSCSQAYEYAIEYAEFHGVPIEGAELCPLS